MCPPHGCAQVERSRYRSIRRVLLSVLALNLAVALAKLVYGTLTRSAAMQADGVHSLLDSTSNVVGLIGMWLAARPADESHPYGHGKFETFTAVAIAAMLCVAGYAVGRGAVEHLLGRGAPTEVGALSFAVMGVTLCINAGVTRWEKRAGRRLGSEVLVADARHTLSDVLVSLGVIVSLIATRLGWQQADGVVALLVAVAILHSAFLVLRDAGYTLGDRARLSPVDLAAVVRAVPGVVDCHSVRTRGSESRVFVDLHVVAERGMSLERGHTLAHEVERAVQTRFAEVADIVVHVEPAVRPSPGAERGP